MATNVNNETGLIGITPKYKFHDQVTIDTGDTIQDVTWLDCEYLAKFKKNSLGPMIVRPDYIYEDTSGSLARNGVTIVGVTTENTLARVTDPEVLRILLANISHTLDNQIRLSEVASGSIGAAWFAGNTKIEVFDCPRGYSVAASAFNGCTGLREVFIQRNVSLGNSAFNGCNRVDCYHFLDTNVGSFGTTVFAGLSGSCYLYVPNESVVNYCKVANLGSYITRIRGHIKGWHLICTDGSYKYNLRDCYDTATNISFRLEGTYVTNLALSVDPETNEATVTVTGMLPDTDENAQLYYEFDYRNHHFSGYVPLHLKTGAAEIIEFEDPEVKRICVANWGGIYRMTLDGYEGELTKEQAAKVSSIGTTFADNKVMVNFPEFQYFISVTYLNAWTFRGCTTLKTVHMPEKLSGMGNGILYQAGGGKTIVMLPKSAPGTPPSTDSTWRSNTFFVHNESIKAYRAKDYWTTIRNRIYGFVSGPIEIMKNGQYQYTLQTYFSVATNFSLTLQQNDYLSMEFSNGVGVVTATGITPDIEEETVNMSYEFYFKGLLYSGTFEIVVKYGEVINFEDTEARRLCVANWGGEYCASTNKYGVSGEITAEQAAAVSSISSVTFFKNVSSFEEIRYFTNLKTITGFKGNTKMTTITLPEGVTTLGTECFRMSRIRYLVLPSTISALGHECLKPVDYCSYIVFKSTNPPSLNANSFGLPSGCKIYVPDAWVPVYKESGGWISYSSRIYPISQLVIDHPDSPVIADLREEGFLPYIQFEDTEVKRVCCLNWGDYTEAAKTETVTDNSNTVSISTAYTYVHKVNTTATRTTLKTLTSSRTKTEDDVVGTTTTTTNHIVGITKAQAAAVTSIGTNSTNEVFRNQTSIVSFKEFVLFTGITSIPYGVGFSGDTNIQSIAWPANLRTLLGANLNSPALQYVEFQDKITSIGNLACFTNSTSLTVICRAVTPPSLGTGNNSFGDNAVNRIKVYVPNESIVTYRGKSGWSNLRSKIYGFVSGPIEIMRNGQYQYELQSCFSGATNFLLTIHENEHLNLEFSDGIGIITATGITSEIENTSVIMDYEFNFRGIQYSGTFEIAVKYREVINFEDAEVKRICVANWGGEYCASTNKYGVSGEITMEQAAAVTSIGNATNGSTVFTDNTNITTFKELIYFVNVKTLGRYFVAGCSNLTEIRIPASVTTFGTYAFVNTPKMKKVYCYPATAPATNTGTFANATSTSMGYNGRNTGTNEFHVPINATGYNSGQYSDRLQNASYCGFTVIYDL